jgi:hypothetical protein
MVFREGWHGLQYSALVETIDFFFFFFFFFFPAAGSLLHLELEVFVIPRRWIQTYRYAPRTYVKSELYFSVLIIVGD